MTGPYRRNFYQEPKKSWTTEDWIDYLISLRRESPGTLELLLNSRHVPDPENFPVNESIKEALDEIELRSSTYWLDRHLDHDFLENYISMPTKFNTLLISKKIDYFNCSWEDAHRILYQQGQFMLTLRQFVDFVNYLKEGEVIDYLGREISPEEKTAILDLVLNPDVSFCGEWLDACFRDRGEGIYLESIHFLHRPKSSFSALKPLVSEPLENYFPCDCRVDLFGSANRQGLPTEKSDRGVFFNRYGALKEEVACFNSSNSENYLSVFFGKRDSVREIGVRPAMFL